MYIRFDQKVVPMKAARFIGIVLLLALLIPVFYGCHSSRSSSDPQWQQAQTLRKEMVEQFRQVEKSMVDLTQQKNSILVQGRTLSEAEIAFAGQVSQLEERLHQWVISETALPDEILPTDDPTKPKTTGAGYLQSVRALQDSLRVIDAGIKGIKM